MSVFAQKVVLITGGAKGIGRALGARLAVLGSHVYLTDIDADGLALTVRDIAATLATTGEGTVEATGRGTFEGTVEGTVLDVTDADAFQATVDHLVARHGGLDFLFNNAGVGATGEAQDLPAAAWDRLIDVNLRGVVHGVRAAYPHMVEGRRGHIVNIACAAGLVPFPLTAAYSATKHGVVGLSTALRSEAARHGVKVSVVCPSVVDTSMFDSIEYFGVDKEALLSPVSRAMMSPDKCAQRILRGLRRNRAIIPIGLGSRLAWGLYRLAPLAFLRLTQKGFQIFRRRFLP